jgi:hypothetical protein
MADQVLFSGQLKSGHLTVVRYRLFNESFIQFVLKSDLSSVQTMLLSDKEWSVMQHQVQQRLAAYYEEEVFGRED